MMLFMERGDDDPYGKMTSELLRGGASIHMEELGSSVSAALTNLGYE
jgi:hypothetical protein